MTWTRRDNEQDKRVGWNIDFYNNLTDDACFVCLTNKEKYLLGQCLEQMAWATRWDSFVGTALPDIINISDALERKLSLDGCTDLCNEIIACIEATPELQEAIANYALTSNINSTSEEIATNLASELVNNPTGCNNDVIFGMSRQLVEFADRLIKDLFEKIDASQLTSTNVGYLIKLIPFVETLPIDEAFELTDKLVDDMETAYLSASTQLLKDEIACDLFCIAQVNGCHLTLEEVRDYFQEKANIVFSYDSVLDFAVDFINGTFVGNAVYYGMNIFFFQIFAFGGKFLDYLFTDYLKVIQSMYNDPDSDWTTLCDECGWTSTLDFTVSDYNAVFLVDDFAQPIGSWSNGVGMITADVTSGGVTRRQVHFRIDFDDSNVTSYDWIGTLNKGNSVPDFNNIVVGQCQLDGNIISALNDIQTKVEFTQGVPTAIDCQLSFTDTIDACRFNGISSSSGYAGSCVVTGLVITGTGAKPSQLP